MFYSYDPFIICLSIIYSIEEYLGTLLTQLIEPVYHIIDIEHHGLLSNGNGKDGIKVLTIASCSNLDANAGCLILSPSGYRIFLIFYDAV